MQCTRLVWIHLAWKIGRMEQQALPEVVEWVGEGGPILEEQEDTKGETWEVTAPTTRVTSRAGQTVVVGQGSEAQELQEVEVVASGRAPD